MKNQVMVYTIVHPESPGGVETVVRGLVSAYRDRGMSVYELRRNECPLHVHGNQRRRLHMPSIVRLLAKLLRVRPAVVNIHFVSSESIYFVLFKRLFSYRLILSFHGSDLLLPDPKSAALMPSILAGADAITVVSQKMYDTLGAMADIDMDRVHLVPNGIDPDFWHPAPEPRPQGRTMMGAGRLEVVKGFDILVAAFAKIAQDFPDARLVIAGKGARGEDLRQQVAAAGLSDRVDFLGLLDREALRAAYHDADLFVMPSRSEGFPIALLEAMATGLPFVAANVGGVREIATEQSGNCVPPEDVAALSHALAVALGRTDLQAAGQAARQRAAGFSVKQAECRYVGLIAGTG